MTEPSHGDSRRRRLWKTIGRDIGAIVLLVTAIIVTVSVVRPIYSGRAPVARQFVDRVPGSSMLGRTTVDSSAEARAVSSPTFERDRRAFAADLVRTGRVNQARADTIAFYAVREAYIRGVPPALIFGVMLTENAVFESEATSDVGAVGLMQVYPRVWLSELGQRLGHDLSSDSTNLKYGAYILSRYIEAKWGTATPPQVTKGLLRYNGCVRGSHTPNCQNYPNKVQRHVEREGQSLCGEKDFYQCVARPFMIGLLGGHTGE